MEKRFFAMLALVLLASAFTSCEYDDSGLWDKLNSLEQQVTANQEDIATLTSLVEALNKGKVIVSTTQTETGYTLTFSDGSSVSITNGKDGDSFFVSIVEQDGMVIITLADGRVIKLPVINYELRVLTFEDEVPISAKTGFGISDLRSVLAASQRDLLGDSDTTLVTNQRHVQALTDARTSLLRVREGLASGLPTDLAAQDIREAIYHLGSIVGEISTDEVLGNIFRNFCIGK